MARLMLPATLCEMAWYFRTALRARVCLSYGDTKRTTMSTLSIRLPTELDARLNAESRIANEPKSLLVRTALDQFLARRRRERFLARLARAAAVADADEAVVLADEALPLDNESLALASGRNPAGESDT